jgi:hypothetical protein
MHSEVSGACKELSAQTVLVLVAELMPIILTGSNVDIVKE